MAKQFYVLSAEDVAFIKRLRAKLENIRGPGVRNTPEGILIAPPGGVGGAAGGDEPELMIVTVENSGGGGLIGEGDIRYARAKRFDPVTGPGTGDSVGVSCVIAHAVGDLIWVVRTARTLIKDAGGSDPTAYVTYQELGVLGTTFPVIVASSDGDGGPSTPFSYTVKVLSGTTTLSAGLTPFGRWRPLPALVPDAATMGIAAIIPAQFLNAALTGVRLCLLAAFETYGTAPTCPVPP